jgi:hypothetical protein
MKPKNGQSQDEKMNERLAPKLLKPLVVGFRKFLF